MIYSIGPSTPSIQSGLHAAIYSIDSDINAVIYVYNEKMVEYMMDNDYLCVNNTTHDYFRREDIVSDVKSLYSNVDPFLNNTFVITGDLEGVAVFGKNLGEAEKSLYSIIHKVLKGSLLNNLKLGLFLVKLLDDLHHEEYLTLTQ